MRRNQKGFTLIELIVVIAILGVLAAIAVPNVMGTLSRAKEDADKATAATIANAALEYLVREHPADASKIAGVVDDRDEGLVKKGYLKEVPTPQNNSYKCFYIETDYTEASTTNPKIEVYYSKDGNTKATDYTKPLYPPSN